jgi:ribosomal protein S18 acetylase RimI-like enzyme
MKPAIHFGVASQEDDSFLCQVFASTRERLLASLPFDAAQREAFVRQQHLCQNQHYRRHYPNASFEIVCSGDQRIGRLYVNRTREEILIIDIALLPEYRGAGIGRELLEDLLAEAAGTGRQVALHVDKFNPALRLYQRLGFRIIQDAGADWAMEWRAGALSTAEPALAGSGLLK